jgi:hypothetical protein
VGICFACVWVWGFGLAGCVLSVCCGRISLCAAEGVVMGGSTLFLGVVDVMRARAAGRCRVRVAHRCRVWETVDSRRVEWVSGCGTGC